MVALVAAAAVVVAVFAWKRREVVAWIRGEDHTIGPDVPGPEPSPPRSLALAASLRSEAFAACADARWALCEQKLDAAKDLDPAGDSAPEVQRARRQAYDGQHPPPESPKLRK